MHIASSALALFILLECNGVVAAPVCSPEKAPLTEFGKHFDLDKRLSFENPEEPIDGKSLGVDARYTRIMIQPSANVSGWKLMFRDQRLRPLQMVDNGSFGTGVAPVWSKRFATGFVYVSLITEGEIPGFHVDLIALEAMPRQAEKPFYSTKGNDPDWLDLYTDDFSAVPPELRKLGEPVGMLTTFVSSASGEASTWCCTGSVTATEPKIEFLTNFHCGGLSSSLDKDHWTPEICAHTIIDFSWDDDSVSMEYACKSVLEVNPKLDAAVLEIVPTVETTATILRAVQIRKEPLHKGEALIMIHHPRCLPKRISQACTAGVALGNWRVSNELTDFAHQCDSEAGSSGAPIFDSAGKLVGLHHLGYHEDDHGTCDNLNKAVSIPSLGDFLDHVP